MRVLTACLGVVAATSVVAAHSGPPFPILTDRVAGAYSISIWTDPDATDDRTPRGQFWVVITKADDGELPPSTRASVLLRALERDGPAAADVQRATAEPVRGDPGNQFAALVMDHEGPYAVTVTVTGPLGEVSVDAHAEATYDLRPPPYMLAWYLMPFVLAGLLWGRLLIRRRRGR
jgi:hypothetical protein